MRESPLNITFDESVVAKRDFYDISVNETKLWNFLSHFGVNNSDIESANFVLTNEHLYWLGIPIPVEGTYSHDQLILNVDLVWEKYFKAHILAERIAGQSKKPHKKQFKQLLQTERLPEYLANTEIPLKRRLRFADKLLVNGANRQFNKVFFHEAKHLIDDKTQPFVLKTQTMLAYGGLIGGAYLGLLVNNTLPSTNNIFLDLGRAVPVVASHSGVGLIFLARVASPAELTAMRFARKRSKEPQWENIFTLQPHLEWKSIQGGDH